MEYSRTLKIANAFASDALERMHEEELAPTPENYELWYTYYAQTNPEMSRAVDLVVANNESITDEHCQELYQRFLSNNRENERVREAGDQIQATIKNVRRSRKS